jgi:hypothetical protein
MNNSNNIPNAIRGRVIVKNGIGCLYDGGEEYAFPRAGRVGKTAIEMGSEKCQTNNGPLVPIVNKTGTVVSLQSSSNIPGVNKSKVGKSEPKKWDPSYYTIQFDDGSYGYAIHEKFIEKLKSGGRTRKNKLRKSRRNRR